MRPGRRLYRDAHVGRMCRASRGESGNNFFIPRSATIRAALRVVEAGQSLRRHNERKTRAGCAKGSRESGQMLQAGRYRDFKACLPPRPCRFPQMKTWCLLVWLCSCTRLRLGVNGSRAVFK